MGKFIGLSAGVLALLLLSSCGIPGFTRNQESRGSAPVGELAVPDSPESGVTDPPAPSPESNEEETGTLEITVVDQNDNNPPGIEVEIYGPVTHVKATDDKGKATFEVPPGEYEVAALPGCGKTTIVKQATHGTGKVVGNAITRGDLQVEWRSRFGPGLAVQASKVPYWPLGQDVQLTFDVIDRCSERRAPNASYPSFHFITSPELVLAEPPELRSDEVGHGRVLVRCVKEGKPKLWMADRLNPADTINLIEYIAPSPGVSEVSCR